VQGSNQKPSVGRGGVFFWTTQSKNALIVGLCGACPLEIFQIFYAFRLFIVYKEVMGRGLENTRKIPK